MRKLAIISLFAVVVLAGCAVSTDSFQTEVVPMDNNRVHADLDAMFAYCAGAVGTRPTLPPPDIPEAVPERIYALADALHVQLTNVQIQLGQGCFGENNRGYLELRECEALQDPELKNQEQKVLASVNKDRKALYYELALYYHHSDLPVSTLEEIAADTHVAHVKSGQWVQMPPLGSRFEQFTRTSLGASLGDKATAAGWVVVP